MTNYLHNDKEINVSEAMYGLVLGVNSWKGEGHITAWLTQTVRHKILENHRRECKRRMEALPEIKISSPKIIDILEEVDKCIQNEFEKQVIDLKIQGYTDQEIGTQLKVCRSTVQAIRKEVQKKLRKLL